MIGRDTLVPALRRRDYAGAIRDAVATLREHRNTAPAPLTAPAPVGPRLRSAEEMVTPYYGRPSSSWPPALPFLLFLLFVPIALIFVWLGRASGGVFSSRGYHPMWFGTPTQPFDHFSSSSPATHFDSGASMAPSSSSFDSGGSSSFGGGGGTFDGGQSSGGGASGSW